MSILCVIDESLKHQIIDKWNSIGQNGFVKC